MTRIAPTFRVSVAYRLACSLAVRVEHSPMRWYRLCNELEAGDA